MAVTRNFLLCFVTVSIVNAYSPLKPDDVKGTPPVSIIEPELKNLHYGPVEGDFRKSDEFATRAENADYRLPENVLPELYKLDLTLPKEIFENEESSEFSGHLEFTFTVVEDTSEIKIHGNKLSIASVTLEEVFDDGTSSPLDLETSNNYESDIDTDIIIIKATDPLTTDKRYKLIFEYTGQIRAASEMNGLYKSYYEAEDGSTKYLVTTQFQPVHARKVFPCLDEPSFKAQFEISITHPNGLNAISNTPSQGQDLGENVVTTFQKTPKMSTYLIAMIISEFTCTPGTKLQGDLEYEVCSRDESENTRAYAVEVGAKLLKSLEDFTGITFAESQIGKMHQFAIPDFSAGAMENWGLVTYRETALLWDPAESSNRYKQRIGSVIAHEFAHMWFGNLITTHWWSDTFLNEGFATYFEAFTTHEVENTWEMDKQFIVEDHQPCMQSDASSTSHALSHPEVYTPAHISGRFGTISYSKGGSVIRMISHILENESFKNGIQDYLANNKFSNTQPSHLLEALNNFVPQGRLPENQDLQTVLKNWIDNPGFPLVSVKLEGTNLILSQQRYLLTGDPGDDEKWYVPITLTTSSGSDKFQNTIPMHWLLPTEDLTIPIDDIADDAIWVVLNNQQAGFYRVDYDDALWARIETALKTENFGEIGEINRAQIVDDIFNFVKDGKRDVAQLFDILDYLRNEESYYAWYPAFTAINTILIRTSSPDVQEKLLTVFLEWMDKVYKSVPFAEAKDDDQIYTHKRVLVQTYACRLGNEECIQNALTAFKDYKDNDKKVDKNLRLLTYCNALRHSTTPREDFDFLWSKYKETKLSTEQVTILQTLGCSRDPEVLKEILDLSLDVSSGIRAQDASSAYTYVYTSNPENVDVALGYIIENHEKITNSRVSLASLISGVANRFTNQEQVEKLRAFGETDGLSDSVKNTITSSTTGAEGNLAWQKKFEESVRAVFDITTTTGRTTTTTTTTGSTTTTEKSSAWSIRLELSCLLISLLLYFKLK